MSRDGAGEWKAHVIEDAASWDGDELRVLLRTGMHGRYSYLRTGPMQLVTPPEGTAVNDAGLVLPRPAVIAIADAVRIWQGHGSDADTEVRVLRELFGEALAVERRRVDQMLEARR